jgi:hypothetical protein
MATLSSVRGVSQPTGRTGSGSNEIVPWKESLAKEMLTKDILDGTVTPDMKPQQVLAMRKVLYEPYAKNFAANYRTLQRSIEKLYTRRDEDNAGVVHDRLLHPPTSSDIRGYPRWDGHAAQQYLKQDVAAGKHKEMLPKELRQTRPEYMLFPLKVFSDHVHQEKNSRHQKSYWINKGKKKQQPK